MYFILVQMEEFQKSRKKYSNRLSRRFIWPISFVYQKLMDIFEFLFKRKNSSS